MEYAKLQLVHTRTPAWRRASPAARGAAVCVLAYIADQEHGGRIPDASSWDDATWRAAIDTPLADVTLAVASRLCSWSTDGALCCSLYDHIGGNALEVKRAQGSHGEKGAEHGVKGAEYGKLGGRPAKEKKVISRGGLKGGIDGGDKGGDTTTSTAETPPYPPYNPPPSSPSIPSIHTSQPASSLPAAAGQDPFEERHPDAETRGSDDSDDDDIANPRLRLVEQLGGWLVDPKSGDVLSDAWITALSIPRTDGGALTDAMINEVFKHAERLTGHALRYPSGFTKALDALRAERRLDVARKSAVATQRTTDERKALQQAEEDAKRERGQRILDAVEAWLASEGAEVLTAITSTPAQAAHLASARRSPGTSLGFHLLGRIYPMLARVAADAEGAIS